MSYPKNPTNVETQHSRITTMASVGHMTQDSCKLWVRLYCSATWWLVVTEAPLEGDLDTLDGLGVPEFLDRLGIQPVYCASALIDESTDLTHTYLVTGLKQGRRYYYSVIADVAHQEIRRRTEIGHQERKFFDSFPNDLSRVSFGFYSCHDPFSNPGHSEGAWPHYYDSLVDSRALLSIGGGDQVYVDTNGRDDMYSVWQWLSRYKREIIKDHTVGGELDEASLVAYFAGIYRSYYRVYWNFVSLKKVHQRFPNYLIWDDHEIMDGWGSYTKDERKKLLNRLFQDDDEAKNDRLIELMFRAAKQVYLEYQHAHNPSTHIDLDPAKNPECEWDYHFKVGDVAFYVLDQRGHHDFERKGQHNALLGDLQMARYQSWLASPETRRAAVAFVVSPVPILHWGPVVSAFDVGPAQDDLRDEWEHPSNRQERNTLLDHALEFSHNCACPVVFLSGDVHSASVYEIRHEDRYPRGRVFNATSSAISRKPAPGASDWFFRKDGPIDGYEGASTKRHFAMAGEYNYFIITTDTRNDQLSVCIDVHWPAGRDGEVAKKRIQIV